MDRNSVSRTGLERKGNMVKRKTKLYLQQKEQELKNNLENN